MLTMNFRPNISILNALLRIICGFTFLSWSIAKMSRKPWNNSYLIISMLAGMKIGEGILRYCPVVDLMNNYKPDTEEEKEEEMMINPS
jgi:hypothetical protein